MNEMKMILIECNKLYMNICVNRVYALCLFVVYGLWKTYILYLSHVYVIFSKYKILYDQRMNSLIL